MSNEFPVNTLFHDSEVVVETVARAYEQLPRDFRLQWDALAGMDAGELAERMRQNFEDEPDDRREILVAYLAQRLGYRRYFRRQQALTVEPLWDLLHPKAFGQLTDGDRQLLWMIAGSTRQVRSYLDPRSALAAIALWRLDDGPLATRANTLLQQKSLPSNERWLYDLIRELAGSKVEAQAQDGHKLIDLARQQSQAGFQDLAALFCGLYLTRTHAPWYTGAVTQKLIKACDLSAERDPWKNRPWLDLMADCALAGNLSQSWLEKPIAASIRMALDDPIREAKLRAFDSRKPYDVTPARLEQIYGTRLRALRQGDARQGAWLTRQVEQTAIHNPRRAMLLLELIIGFSNQGVGSSGAQLVQVLSECEVLDPLLERLASLYVRCFAVEPHAVQFVTRHHKTIIWEQFEDVRRKDIDVYMTIADYDGGFAGRLVEYAGARIEHNDKDAAAHVRYFREKRTHPNTVTGIISNLAVPDQWLAGNIGESGLMNAWFESLMSSFERDARQENRDHKVIDAYGYAGIPIESIHDVGHVSTAKVIRLVRDRRHKPLVLAAMLGATSGALAPKSMGLTAVLDAPIFMKLVAHVCADLCRFYGFDPAENPQLPVTILAIALEGAEPTSVDPVEVHRLFHAFLVRKSIIIAAASQGAGAEILGGTLMSFFDTFRASRSSARLSRERLMRWLRREENSWKHKVLGTANNLALPTLEGLVGAALNLSLIYDVCESAEAVLTDRFLAQKYPDWRSSW